LSSSSLKKPRNPFQESIAGNRFLGCLKGLQIRAGRPVHVKYGCPTRHRFLGSINVYKFGLCERWIHPNGANVFCFLSSFPPPPHQHDSVRLQPGISLLFSNSVSRLVYPYDWRLRGFLGAQKKTSVGLVVFHNSSIISMKSLPVHPHAHSPAAAPGPMLSGIHFPVFRNLQVLGP
jgi:hypothetical protein